MNKNFSSKTQNRMSLGFVVLIVILCSFVTISLAFFFADDFASNGTKMSGKVDIEAVGVGTEYKSIEDTATTTKLVVNLDSDLDVLIPGMPVSFPANCKVYQSTTHPLLRAKIEIELYEDDLYNKSVDESIATDIYTQLVTKINSDNWFLHSDGYFYYVEGITQVPNASEDEYVLTEIDFDGEEYRIIDFLGDSKITFPTWVDSTYSGKGVAFVIYFQAIQNYIPDDDGIKMDNTIVNSQTIFNYFDESRHLPTDISLFEITESNGVFSLNRKAGVEYPETVILPSVDSEGNPITTLGTTFAGDCGSIKKLIVPSSYTTLSYAAFHDSTLQSVDLSQTSIETIPMNCFRFASSLKTVKLPEKTLKYIDYYAFEGSGITSLNIPEGCEEFMFSGFRDIKSLVSLYIPSTVTYIGSINGSISNVLQKIVVHPDNPYYTDNNDDMLIDIESGDLIMAISIFPNTTVTIPNIVTRIGPSAMCDSNVTHLNLSAGLESISNQAGLPKGLLSVSIPESNTYFYLTEYELVSKSGGDLLKVFSQGNSAFDYNVPETVKSISKYSLSGCKFSTFHISKNVKSVNVNCFGGAIRVKKFTVDESNQYITVDNNVGVILNSSAKLVMYAGDCTNTSYTVPNGIEIINTNCFRSASYLSTVTLPDGLTEIGEAAFLDSSITSINIPSSVEYIDYQAFYNTKLSSISIYGEIGAQAFGNIEEMKTIVVNSSASYIEYETFINNSGLEWVEFKATTPPVFEVDVLMGCTSDFKIYVPDGSVDAYKTVADFNVYADKILPVSARP